MNESNQNMNEEQLQHSEKALSSSAGFASGVVGGTAAAAAELMGSSKNKKDEDDKKEDNDSGKNDKKEDNDTNDKDQSNKQKDSRKSNEPSKEKKSSGDNKTAATNPNTKKAPGMLGKAGAGLGAGLAAGKLATNTIGKSARALGNRASGNLDNQGGAKEKSDIEKSAGAVDKAAKTAAQAAAVAIKGTLILIKMLLNPLTLGILGVFILVVLVAVLMISIDGTQNPPESGGHGAQYLAGQDVEFADPEEKAFYDKIKEAKTEKMEIGVSIDTNVLIATLTYKTLTTNEEFEESGDSFATSVFTTWEKQSKDIDTLVANMISGSDEEGYRLDLEKYYEYLRDTYLPAKFGVRMSEFNYTDEEKKQFIEFAIEDIKLLAEYYKDLLSGGMFGSMNIMCSEIEVEGIGKIPFEDYIAGVINSETSPGVITSAEARRAVAIAARTYALVVTNNCTTPIKNSQAHQVFDNGVPISPLVLEDVEATKGLVITYEGELFLSEYDAFGGTCSGGVCTATYLRLPNKDGANIKHTITAPKNEVGWAAGHSRGMSQYYANYLGKTAKYSYEEILKFFYREGVEIKKMSELFYTTGFIGTEGIEAELLFPVAATPDRAECVSAREYYSGGKYHGSTDIFDAFDGVFNELPIISSTNGRIIGLINNQYCANPEHTNSQVPPLQYRSGCAGNGIRIMIDDPESNYNGVVIAYWHFDKVNPELKVGDTVSRGQFLGFMGSTGNSTGPHLHYNVSKGGCGKGCDILVDRAMSNYCKYAFENR